MTTDLRAHLDRLDTALAAATPGPWEQDGEYREEIYNGESGSAERMVAECRENAADAALIVAAVNALPDLLAAVRGAADLADQWSNTERNPYAVALNAAGDRLRAALAAALTEGDAR